MVKVNGKHISIILFASLMFFVTFSGTRLPTDLITIVSFVLLIAYAFKSKPIICIPNYLIGYLISAFYMIAWSRSTETTTVYYIAIYVLMLLICLCSKSLLNQKNTILLILVVFSVIGVYAVIAEYFLGNRFLSLFSRLFSSQRLISEQRRILLHLAPRGFSSANIIGHHAAMISFYCVIFLYKSTGQRWKKFLSILLLFSCIFIVLIIGERSNVVIIPAVIMLVYLIQNSNKGFVRNIIYLLMIIILLYLLAVLFSPFLSNFRTIQKLIYFGEAYSNSEDFSNGRIAPYSRAIELWLRHPIIGNGWFSFYRNNMGIVEEGAYSHVHNLILELMSDGGIIGLGIVIVPMIKTLHESYKSVKNNKILSHQDSYKICLLSFTYQAYFLVDSLLHITFYSRQLIVLYFLSIILFIAASNDLKKRQICRY